jgi:hypothetical protein
VATFLGFAAYVVFVSLGIWGIITGLRIKNRIKKEVPSWPVAEGLITSSEIKSYSQADNMTAGKLSSNIFYPEIKFKFISDGTEYESDKITWGGQFRSNDIELIKAKIEKYPVGKKIVVHYNPLSPSDCIVEIRESGEAKIPLYCGLLFVLFATALLVTFFLPTEYRPVPTILFFAVFGIGLFFIVIKKPSGKGKDAGLEQRESMFSRLPKPVRFGIILLYGIFFVIAPLIYILSHYQNQNDSEKSNLNIQAYYFLKSSFVQCYTASGFDGDPLKERIKISGAFKKELKAAFRSISMDSLAVDIFGQVTANLSKKRTEMHPDTSESLSGEECDRIIGKIKRDLANYKNVISQ